MSALLYYLFVYPISKLPFPILYLVSDFTYLMLFYVIGHRKEVVLTNLKNSFPEKPESELKKIRKAFYHHFCDTILESIKGFTISEDEANKRMTYTNTQVFDALYKQNKNVIMVGGHYANWELLAITVAQQMQHQCNALYTPLKNPFWENKMKTSRSRFGLNMIGIKEVKRLFDPSNTQLSATIFGSDQSPRKPEKAYWTTFLNQDTGIQYGAEKYAKELNAAVVFGSISKIKRGHYNTNIELLFSESQNLPYGEVMEAYNKKLEAQIIADPRYYLWTHKRWKHKRPNGL